MAGFYFFLYGMVRWSFLCGIVVWTIQIVEPFSSSLIGTSVKMRVVILFVLCAGVLTGFPIGAVYFVESEYPALKVIVVSAMENHRPVLYLIGMS